MSKTDRLNLVGVAAAGLQALGGVEEVIRNSKVDPMLQHLVKLRVSQINQCAHCMGMHTVEAREAGESQDRLDCIIVWRDSDLFIPAERATLAWSEALTTKGGNADLAALHGALKPHFDDEEIGTLMLVIVMINTWNRLQIASHAAVF